MMGHSCLNEFQGMEIAERFVVSGSLLKNISNWVATQAVRCVLQSGPRTQNLRILDMTGGHCPPLHIMQRQAILVMWHEFIYLQETYRMEILEV